MLGERILCFEGIDRQEMRLLLSQATLCCLASKVEACPNILLEAMACGAAILAPDNEPFPEILGSSGCLYESKLTESLAFHMRPLCHDLDLRHMYKRSALRRSKRFSARKCAERTMEMLETVARRGKHRP